MADCVAIAREVGAELAARHKLPVFLYEEAASTPARRNLEDIRRGEFEGLAKKMTSPEWAPDFGPATPHPSAGASVVVVVSIVVSSAINVLHCQAGQAFVSSSFKVNGENRVFACIRCLRRSHVQILLIARHGTDL